MESLKKGYKVVKKILKIVILTAKEEAQKNLLETVDGNTWGKLYKTLPGC